VTERTPLHSYQAIQNFVAQNPDILQFGCVPAGPAPSGDKLRRFLDQGRHASMDYMERQLEQRLDPRQLEPWAVSLILFALKPATRFQPLPAATSNRKPRYSIAAYARGEDYHHRAYRHIQALKMHLQKNLGDTFRFRGFVDTSPLFERDFAAAAGLGWRAKNATILNRQYGSGFLLMGALVDFALPASQPVQEFCGGCTRCLDACPTQAFLGPGELDARRCISYWTIEHRGELPADLAPQFDSWAFGCDICQSICPWNRKHLEIVADAKADAIQPEEDLFNLNGPAWLDLVRAGGGFKSRFKNSPLLRTGRKGMMRNIANAAANQNDLETLPQLKLLLTEETDKAVRAGLEEAIRRLTTVPIPGNSYGM
jgi:epoxyqueuosine reductase